MCIRDRAKRGHYICLKTKNHFHSIFTDNLISATIGYYNTFIYAMSILLKYLCKKYVILNIIIKNIRMEKTRINKSVLFISSSDYLY